MWNLRRVFPKLGNSFRRERAESELTREVESHLALMEEEFRRRGMGPHEARLAAKREFGGMERTKELQREERVFIWFDDALRDLGHAFRMYRRNPLLTATAIVCLALGIGGTTAVFSVIDGVLLRPLPYPEPDRLVVLRTTDFQNSAGQGRVSEAELGDWQAAATSFDSIAGYRWATIDLVESEHSERLQGLFATPEFFRVFGVQPVVGHSFQANGPPGFILGAKLWERRFASDPSVVGRTISVGICCPQQPQTLKMPVSGAVDRDIPFPPTIPGIRDRGHGVNDLIDYWFPVYVKGAK